MKRVGGLYDRIGERGNLTCALWRAARGRRRAREVAKFLATADSGLNRLASDLARERVEFGPYRAFSVRDTKRRDIMAPPFEQRVLHHALIAVAGPILERSATPRSFACRRGLGHGAALARAREFARAAGRCCGWYLKLDIERYYDSLPHARLMELVERRFRERRLLRLFGKLVDSHHAAPGKGLPIGALTSQYLSNAFLDGLDHRVLAQFAGSRYLRYMDDMVCWGPRQELVEIRDVVGAWLGERGLVLAHGGELQRAESGAPWFGFVVYPDRVRLGRAARARLGRRYRAARRDFEQGRSDDLEFQARATALFAWASQADDLAWRRALLRRLGEFGDAQGKTAGRPRRVLEQQGGGGRLGLPEQEAAR